MTVAYYSTGLVISFMEGYHGDRKQQHLRWIFLAFKGYTVQQHNDSSSTPKIGSDIGC
jgi:hypothetical protein